MDRSWSCRTCWGSRTSSNRDFLRRYADLHAVITSAVGKYVEDVKAKNFPNQEEKY
jgi:ketopantoate hydroxymethyltransferase